MKALDVLSALVTAVLTAAASRPWGLGILALAAYVPVFLALCRTTSIRSGALLAAVAALGLNSVAYEAAQGLFPGGYVVTLLVASLPYVLVGAVAVRMHHLLRDRLGSWGSSTFVLAGLPVLWAAAEWLPSRPELLGVWTLPLGFIGYSQVDLPTVHLARYGSVTAVSSAVLIVNAVLAHLWSVLLVGPQVPVRRGRRLAAGAAIAAALVVASTAASAAVPVASGAAPSTLTVRLVQPNLPDSAYFAARVHEPARSSLIAELAALMAGSSADLVLLPEAAWPGSLDVAGLGSYGLTHPFASTATVLFGAPAKSGSGSGPSNSVFALADGRLEHLYAKRRLVPIGEGHLQGGDGSAVLEIGGVGVAPLVCYDALFPTDVREAVRSGARLLAVLTDDAFAAGSDVPGLHLRAARLRAIESGVPVVLAANTGPSAVIDSRGRVLARLPRSEQGYLEAEVPVVYVPSPYVRHGDWWGGANAVAATSLVAAFGRGGSASRRST